MDKLEAMRSFAGVVAHGGFSAAARATGLSRSAVSKHVIELEAALGVQLLNRTTRQVHPTEAGLAYYERVRAVLAEIEEADIAVSRQRDEPRGLMRLNAPMSFGTLHLAPALADFMVQYPDLQVQMTLNDRFVDPVAEGFDVTIRIAELADSSLVARRIVDARRVICAAPDVSRAPRYAARARRPAPPRLPALRLSRHRRPVEADRRTAATTGCRCRRGCAPTTPSVLRTAALKGLGIAFLPTFVVGMDLQEGSLETVLTAFETPPVSVYALYPPSRYLSAKVRLMIDFLVARFGDRPHWDLVG